MTAEPIVLALSDRDLLDLAGEGGRAAFGVLYDRHAATVYRHAWSIVRNDHDAQDVTQDVFVAAWKGRRRIRVVDSSILPWLLTTSRYIAQSLIRQRRHSTTASLDAVAAVRADAAALPDEVAALAEFEDAIEAALSELPEPDQILYSLCIDEGLSYAEAARAMGTSHSAVRNRLSRLRAVLRVRLNPFGGNAS